MVINSYYLSGFNFVIDSNQTYALSVPYNYNIQDFSYFILNIEREFGANQLGYEKETQWNVYWSAIKTECDYYGTCEAFGICHKKAFQSGMVAV